MALPRDSGELRPSSTRAAGWTLAARQGERLLGVISIAILARALSPHEFGLVAMAGSVVALIEVLAAFGFDWALVRIREPSRADYDTAWTLRVLTGIATFAALSAAAYPAALYFRQTAIAWIVVAMGANGFIASLENIGIVDFRRAMRFDREFTMRIGSRVAGTAAAVTYALLTHSYWALVLGITVGRVAWVVLSYAMHPFRPRWDLSRRAGLLDFSVWIQVAAVTEALRARFADVWIGRYLGSTSVGFYSMTSELSAVATSEFAAPINRAVYVTYLELGGRIGELRERFLRVSGIIWAIGMPMAVGMFVTADQVVAVLLGSQWRSAAEVLRILTIAALINVTASNTHYVYWALGRPKFVTMLSLIGAAAFLLFTPLFGRSMGITGVATAQVLACLLAAAIIYTSLRRTLELPLRVIAARNYRVVVASFVMAACVRGAEFALVAANVRNAVIQLPAMVITGVAAYFVALGGLWLVLRRPPGPEGDMVDFAVRQLGRLGLYRARSDSALP
jgi:PST family polysaccharide transporter